MKDYHLSKGKEKETFYIPEWIFERFKEWNMMKHRKQKVKFRKRQFGKKVIGFDTETQDGYCKLICDSEGRYMLCNSIEDCLAFLTNSQYRNTINLFWNIDYDFFAIIKYLPEEYLEGLYELHSIKYGKYQINWIPKKMFAIEVDKKKFLFFDLWQYYRMSLDAAAKKYLNDSKIEIDKEKFDDPNFWRENLSKIIDYCIKDAELTAKLGSLLQQKLEAIGISFDRPYSCGRISLAYFASTTEFPTYIPSEYQEYAFYSYFGGRFELLKRGYIEKVYYYDINSAYPYQIANLLDINKGEWVKARRLIEEADIGFLKIVVRKHPDSEIQPFCYREKGLVYYPKMKNVLHFATLDEVLFALDNYDDIEIDIIDGWYFLADEYVYPFKHIEEIYKKRKEIKKKDPVFQLVLKIIMNSLYGKFAERKKACKIVDKPLATDEKYFDGEQIRYVRRYIKIGEAFNPVYASLITARTRLQLLEKALKRPNDIVAMFTDAIMTEKPFIEVSSELGEWNLETQGEGLFLLCGVYTIRNNEEVITKLRGIHIKDKIDLIEEIKHKPDTKDLEWIWKKALKLGEVLKHHNLYTIQDLNRFIDYRKELHINAEQKRIWQYEPKTYGELLDQFIESTPKEVIYI